MITCVVYTIVYFTNYWFSIINNKLNICLSLLLNCMKVKCETNSFGSRIVVVFWGLSPSSASVQHDNRIDTYWLISALILTVLSQPYCYDY